jgi:hypothetical protein
MPLHFALQRIHECDKRYAGNPFIYVVTPFALLLDRMHNTCRRSCLYFTALLPDSSSFLYRMWNGSSVANVTELFFFYYFVASFPKNWTCHCLCDNSWLNEVSDVEFWSTDNALEIFLPVIISSVYRIWGSHSGGYEEFWLLCSPLKNHPMFRLHLQGPKIIRARNHLESRRQV